jgi:hypothetical protein
MEFLCRRIATGREDWVIADARDVRFAEERMVTRGAIPNLQAGGSINLAAILEPPQISGKCRDTQHLPTISAPVFEGGILEFEIRYERL